VFWLILLWLIAFPMLARAAGSFVKVVIGLLLWALILGSCAGAYRTTQGYPFLCKAATLNSDEGPFC